MAQANTTFIGRFTQPQDIDKVRHLLKESGGDQDLVAQLPTLDAGQFQMVAPDVDPAPIPIQCRWLYTDHGAPLNEEQVEEATTPEIRAWAKARSSGAGRSRGKGAAAAAAKGSTWKGDEQKEAKGIVESARIKSIGGMTAAAHGIVDDSAFEVKLMGGLSVLKDGRDPLYVMQATVNASTSLVMGWTLIALMLAWRDSSVDWWWLAGSFVLTACVGLVISLEMLLSHDGVLLLKLSKFARWSQIIIIAWLWGLLYWSFNGLDLRGAEPFLEVVVVWVTLFLLIDFWNRIQLGKIRWNGGNALSKLKGLTAVLTDSQLTDMQSNSKQILAGLRWILDFVTLTWLCAIMIDDSADYTDRITLWIASLYALTFGSETWLRLRGRMPEVKV